MYTLEEYYNAIVPILERDSTYSLPPEPLNVIKCAEAHRAYWRPKRVRVILLAESHVYTTASEMDRRIDFRNIMNPVIPKDFVRLVYCLGYGENNLLNKPIQEPPNSGTPQYWKIFYSCVNRIASNRDFIPILKKTPFEERIQNKIALLERLMKAGIWLLDASLAAVYFPTVPKPKPSLIERCLQVSWDIYLNAVVREANPSIIVCAGRGVFDTMHNRLKELRIPITWIYQPNARLNSLGHINNFLRLYDICCRTNSL